jgi:dTDP-4-dehydrorhamnose 3,5-epimerase
MSKHFLIIGANGQLGQALQQRYPEAAAVDSDVLDITDMDAVEKFNWDGITTIINAAAWTNVDGAETAKGREISWLVNAVGPRNLTQIANRRGLTLIHISSDYVFDGQQKNHAEDEHFTPLSVYGQNKAAGDIAVSLADKHYILRTSWVIGNGKNFLRTMAELAGSGVRPSVVNDQFGRLTFVSELVRAIDHLLQTAAAYGVYNVTNSGEIKSWAEIAADTFEILGFERSAVTGISTAEYFADKENIAPRPTNSDMNLAKIQATGFVSEKYEPLMKKFINSLKEDK